MLRIVTLVELQLERFAHLGGHQQSVSGGSCDLDRLDHSLGRIHPAHDVLTDPPDWAIEHLRRLHDDGRLSAARLDDLTTRIVGAAVHLDRRGHLPDRWSDIEVRPATRPLPVVEISAPEP